jgi:hypothetical protein
VKVSIESDSLRGSKKVNTGWDGRTEHGDGRWKMEDGRWKMEDGRKSLGEEFRGVEEGRTRGCGKSWG